MFVSGRATIAGNAGRIRMRIVPATRAKQTQNSARRTKSGSYTSGLVSRPEGLVRKCASARKTSTEA